MPERIDLHLHTTYSDGRLPPRELLRNIRAAGVGVAAIADHDTVDGLAEAAEEADRLGIRLIPATELSIEHRGQDLHVLAYFVDTSDPDLRSLLRRLRRAREVRLHAMVERLHQLGLPIREEEVLARAGSQATVGRLHLAGALVDRGWVPSIDAAFRHYIGSGSPAYREKGTVPLRESMRILLGAGAVPVLAHPGTYDLSGTLEDLLEAGLQGLEAYHPSHQAGEVLVFRELAHERGLIVTGGSDYHGDREDEPEPGSLPIGLDLVRRLEERRLRIPEIRKEKHGLNG